MLLYKLRQTWNEMFLETKLHMIDMEANKIDSAWPIIASSADHPNASIYTDHKSETSKVSVKIWAL